MTATTTGPATPTTFDVFSPIDGTKLGEAPSLTIADALDGLRRARTAQGAWAALPLARRCRTIRALVDALRRRQDEVADLLVNESGKSRFEAYVFEVSSIVHLGAYFTENAERILAPRRISISLFKNRTSYIHYRPRGVALVIAPWNFPLSNSMGEVLMALIAGNAVLLKPASLTPLTALRMRALGDEVGIPADLFQVLTGPGRLASELIEQGDVDFVSFTGSTETGRRVAELCGRRLVPCTMELGGKAPAVVLPDADLENASRSVVWGAFANSGQICASIERAFVCGPLYDRFVERVVAITRTLRQGDPRGAEVDIGSMTDPRQVDVVDALVQDAVAQGARVLTGGRRAAAGRNFYEPTVLVDVNPGMRVMREESFGPLLPIMRCAGEDEAVRLANDTRYGLLASVYCGDQAHGRRVAERLEAGTVIVNDALVTHAYPETPWQGIKESGFGRVHSDDGLRDLCLGLHVNHEVLSVASPTWYPYTREKLSRLLTLTDLAHAEQTLGEKLHALGDLVRGRRG